MDYKKTVFLPETSFPIRSQLVDNELKLISQWKEQKLYQTLRKLRKGSKLYVLHYGPPYANGHIHVGHAFTGILKDIVCRSHSLAGEDAPLVPGWDCHGLPIELKVEEELHSKGMNKMNTSLVNFRNECKSFAGKWISTQREELERLGILADWENPYVTMSTQAQTSIAELLIKLVSKGYIFRDTKPVKWSVTEETAIADAEVEYRDRLSRSVYIKFVIESSHLKYLEGSSVIVWTTTPWSLPGCRAIAHSDKEDYALITANSAHIGSNIRPGEKFLLSTSTIKSLTEELGILSLSRELLVDSKSLSTSKTFLNHPLLKLGYDKSLPLLPSHHVEKGVGTGFVHVAPGHGEEDFKLGRHHNLDTTAIISHDGFFYDSIQSFGGVNIFSADDAVIKQIRNSRALMKEFIVKHSYPYSLRSGSPLIYRTTAQWFADLSSKGQSSEALREIALREIKNVQWFPPNTENRISNMVSIRPDWCLSRQRIWGIPIALFVNKATKNILIDEEVNSRILNAFKEKGSDSWFVDCPQSFLGEKYSDKEYDQVTDILDVWFDAGATQQFVLRERSDLSFPADVYLEGSDQHRGWFQSSLLIGCALHGRAPYKKVVTHGFVLDDLGRKMSKSRGNVVDPSSICQSLGAEVLRLWVVSCDYTGDLNIGKDILKSQQEIYKRYRKTLRYLIGSLNGFDKKEETLSYHELGGLEKWILYRLFSLYTSFEAALENFAYKDFYTSLHTFCSSDLSSYYFDIKKDCLYCDHPKSIRRRSVRTALNLLYIYLCKWLAPVLCFTAEEAWRSSFPNESVHLSTLQHIPYEWNNKNVAEHYETARKLRREITAAIEVERNKKNIKSSLQAAIVVYDPEKIFDGSIDYAELAIVSRLSVHHEKPQNCTYLSKIFPNLGVSVQRANGIKCQRCWKTVTYSPNNEICLRCYNVIKDLQNSTT